jgi:hypothetical protein
VSGAHLLWQLSRQDYLGYPLDAAREAALTHPAGEAYGIDELGHRFPMSPSR